MRRYIYFTGQSWLTEMISSFLMPVPPEARILVLCIWTGEHGCPLLDVHRQSEGTERSQAVQNGQAYCVRRDIQGTDHRYYAGSLDDYSYPTDYYAGADAYNYIVNYSEAQFLAAEATLIRSGAAAAEPLYQAAIANHMKKLGVVQIDVDAHIATRGTLTAGNALQRIMEEKSIANFLNEENFTDWRRTGFPLLTKVQGGMSDIPRRLLYPESEILTNPQPQQTAVLTDRVWWDAQ